MRDDYLKAALKLAHTSAAAHLPGWSNAAART